MRLKKYSNGNGRRAEAGECASDPGPGDSSRNHPSGVPLLPQEQALSLEHPHLRRRGLHRDGHAPYIPRDRHPVPREVPSPLGKVPPPGGHVCDWILHYSAL